MHLERRTVSRSGVLCNDFLLLAGLATRPLHLAWSPFFLGLEVCLPSHVNEQLERVMPWRSWVVLVHKPQKNNKKTWKVTPTKKTPGTAVPLLRTSLSLFFFVGARKATSQRVLPRQRAPRKGLGNPSCLSSGGLFPRPRRSREGGGLPEGVVEGREGVGHCRG